MLFKYDRDRLKGREKIHHANINEIKSRLATLISDRVDFTAKQWCSLPKTERDII